MLLTFMSAWKKLESFGKKEPSTEKNVPTRLACDQARGTFSLLMIEV